MSDDQSNPMNYSEQDDLLFLPLGGSGEIGMNLNLYCCDGAMADGRPGDHLCR